MGSTATVLLPNSSFRKSPAASVPPDPVAATKAASESDRILVAKRLEQPAGRDPGDLMMREIVRELGELIEDDVLGVARELGAGVVDFLDVGF